MIRFIHYIMILFVACFLSSCQDRPSSLSPREYIKWVEDEDNGLLVDRKMPPLSYRVQYKPVDYIIAREERTDKLSKETILKRRKDLQKMDYFTLRISTNGKDVLNEGVQSKEEYYMRQNYLTYDFQKDIALVIGTDTAGCSLFQMVGNYGLAPYVDFVIGFERKANEENEVTADREVILADQTFGNGILKFIIKKENINHVPEIKTF
jgi:hypothetical protein